MTSPLQKGFVELFVYLCLWGLLGWRIALSIFLIHWLINILTDGASA